MRPQLPSIRQGYWKKQFTCYDGVQEQILDGHYVKETVVVDGHLTTSRGPQQPLPLPTELVDQLGGDAETLRTGVLYRDVFGKKSGKTGVKLSFFYVENSGKSSLFS